MAPCSTVNSALSNPEFAAWRATRRALSMIVFTAHFFSLVWYLSRGIKLSVVFIIHVIDDPKVCFNQFGCLMSPFVEASVSAALYAIPIITMPNIAAASYKFFIAYCNIVECLGSVGERNKVVGRYSLLLREKNAQFFFTQKNQGFTNLFFSYIDQSVLDCLSTSASCRRSVNRPY